MEIQRAIELLKIERECIDRNNQPFGQNCDRNCGKCDLVQNTDELIEMYDFVIEHIANADKMIKENNTCSNGKPCIHPNCKRCGTTHFMSDCDYGKEKKNELSVFNK